MKTDQVKLNDAIKLIYYAMEQFKLFMVPENDDAEKAHNTLKEGIEKIMAA